MANISNEKLINVIPSVGEYQRELDSLNNQLGKTTLTGKISSLDVAETLFIYMEETQERFSKLQQGLVDSLVSESLNKVAGDINSKVTAISAMIETTMKNRGADSVLLAQDRDVKQFIKDPHNSDVKSKVYNGLKNFLEQYSFYKDIFIIDKSGNIKMSFNSNIKACNEPFLKEAMGSNEYYESYFGESALEVKNRYSFFYAAKVQDNNETIGAVVLSFDLESEMNTIKRKGEVTISSVLSQDGIVMASTNNSVVGVNTNLKRSRDLNLIKYKGIDYLSKSKSIKMEDTGFSLYSNVMIPLTLAFKKDEHDNVEIDDEVLENSHLISKELRGIRDQSEEINEDLIDVVINGEIIASKKRAYALNPILENIRIISERINVSFSSSIADIHNTIISSRLDDVLFRSSTALSMLSRILYFQINNARHTASIDEIKEVMSKKEKNEDDIDIVRESIERVNTLNSNYHNIYVFDTSGMVIATSNASEAGMIGKGVESDIVRRALSSSTSGSYIMTSFAPSQSYSHKKTYVVSSPIMSNDKEHVAGAVSIVLDGKPQISSILRSSIPIDEEGVALKNSYAMLTNREGVVLAVEGDTNIESGDQLSVPTHLYANVTPKGFSELVNIDGANYVVGSTAIDDYRGFYIEENKRNDIVALVFAKI